MSSFAFFALAVATFFGVEESPIAEVKRDASLFCVFHAEVARVIDGDTVIVTSASPSICANALKEKRLSAFMGTDTEGGDYRIRLIGIDAPERGEKGFRKARQFVHEWFKKNPQFLVVYSELRDVPTRGKFGRLLGAIAPRPIEGHTTVSLNAELLSFGFADFVHYQHNDTINFLEWQIRQNSESISSKPTAP